MIKRRVPKRALSQFQCCGGSLAFSVAAEKEGNHCSLLFLEIKYPHVPTAKMSIQSKKDAYWNAAAIAADYTEQAMQDAINLFATENLSEGE